MIKSKEQIIEYFKSGIKQTNDFRIGIEHEKFLFDNHNNKRISYSKIKGNVCSFIRVWLESYFRKR